MNGQICHSGIVDGVSASIVRVRITRRDACRGCKAADNCAAVEGKEMVVEVRCASPSMYCVGQEVTLTAERSVGLKAVALGFVAPLALLLATVFAAVNCGLGEATAAAAGLAALAPYYATLYLCRGRLESAFAFSIKD